LGLLLALFRQIERWLHQHIFKVGWLLTNNYQITTVLYYIIFLPGILLHESTLWLTAGLLNVRADRAIQFPEQQEIGELRLNFIRLSAETGLIRLTLIKMAPLLAGVAALWAISGHVLNLDQFADASGAVDDLAVAVSQMLSSADFWLWFYLAFTVANTMFPEMPKKLSAGQWARLAVSAAACLLLIWWLGGALDLSIALGAESLLESLALVTLQIIIMNVLCLIVLGAAESLIERATGKSAAFEDGVMIAMARAEAQARLTAQAEARRAARQNQPAQSHSEIITSVYDLKLPIPGPPGREPVSRSVVAVVSVEDDAAASAPVTKAASEFVKPSEAPTIHVDGQPRDRVAASAPTQTMKPARKTSPRLLVESSSLRAEKPGGEHAPFSRPFVEGESARNRVDGSGDDDVGRAEAGLFPRPFSMKTRLNTEEATEFAEPDDSSRERLADSEPAARRHPPKTAAARTRPAPKPSHRPRSGDKQSQRSGPGELSYEPLDDDDIYLDNEDVYDDEPSSS